MVYTVKLPLNQLEPILKGKKCYLLANNIPKDLKTSNKFICVFNTNKPILVVLTYIKSIKVNINEFNNTDLKELNYNSIKDLKKEIQNIYSYNKDAQEFIKIYFIKEYGLKRISVKE